MFRTRPLFLTLALAGLALAAPTSRYTSLRAQDCRTLKVSEPDSSLQRCPGVAGYALLVEEGDLRQSVTLVYPDGRRFPLDLWTHISSAFSFLGERAEWRLTQGRPSALIVRLSASEDPDHPERHTSYLAVARIGQQVACLTARIAPGADMNLRARAEADRAASRPCLKAR